MGMFGINLKDLIKKNLIIVPRQAHHTIFYKIYLKDTSDKGYLGATPQQIEQIKKRVDYMLADLKGEL